MGKRLEDFDRDNKIRGTVFLDINENGRREKGEQGIANIQVSNGLDITLTDNQGYFELNKEGYFIYITLPDGFKMTTSWYRIISDKNMDFGLTEYGEKGRENFTFIHLTDPHTDLDESHNQIIKNAVEEINNIDPDFVVVTGDIILEGDKTSIEQARRWFNRYVSLIDRLDMPIYHTMGNHDVAGIHYKKDVSEVIGYNKWLYYSYFGPTYYSFDWGNFHCIVLDPNQFEEGTQYFEISKEQMSWLKRALSFYEEDTPLLVFFHEPINSWTNKDEVIHFFGERKVRLFSGHWHFDILLAHQGEDILEQVTGALCGEWWKGPNLDGRPGGYRIFQINGDQIDSFYREIGKEQQIELIEPEPMVSQLLDVTALIHTEHAPLISAEYQINQGKWISMNIDNKDNWYVSKGNNDSTIPLEPGYHQIEIKAKDQLGEFSRIIHFKIGSKKSISFRELYHHFSTYKGYLIQVEGKIIKYFTESRYNSPSQEFINGAIILRDHGGYSGLLVLGEYGISKEEELGKGRFVIAETVPLQYRWDSLSRKYKLTILLNLFRLPKGFFVIEKFLKPEAVRAFWVINYQINKEK